MYCVSLRRQVCLCRLCVSEMRFISACYRQNVAYVPEISIFQLRQTHNEFGAFPRRWIKDWFQVVVPVAFACELTPLICFPFGGRNNAEYVLLYSFENKRGQ